jgi:glyoxylase-like metal-dependent hydrolase (beta-lactamase superfamily II)
MKRGMTRVVAGSIAVVVVLAISSFAGTADTVKQSQKRAADVLNAAVEAMGGAKALGEVKTIILDTDAELYPRLQTPTPEPPFEHQKMHEVVTYDLANSKLAVEQTFKSAGFENNGRSVIVNGEGNQFDLRAHTVTPLTGQAATGPQFGQYYRRLPNLILNTALTRTQTLRYLGEEKFNGKPHDVITFVHTDGTQMAVYVDRASHLVSKYELIYPDALTGDEASEIVYDGYTAVNGVKVPTGWTFRQAGQEVGKFHYKVQINPTLGDSAFAADTTGFAKVTPNDPNRKLTVEKLAENVYVLQNVAPGYNMLAVGFPDYIFAMEAPMNSSTTEAAIARIKELMPNKPIKYVAVSHFHNDHMGGIRSFVAEGSTVISTEGNAKVINAYVSAPLKDALAKSPKKLQLETLQGTKRVLSGGEETVEIYNIGSPHAKDMLIAYLPKERLLFQGDLFFAAFEDNPIGPAQPVTIDMAGKIKELGLQVDKIAAVHGRTTTSQELADSLRLKPGEEREAAGGAR